MSNTTRRTVVLSAAVAAATLGLGKRLAIAQSNVPTPKQPPQRPQKPKVTQPKQPPANPVERFAQTPDPVHGFHRYKVGDATCTALYDGIWEKAHDSGFFSNASVDDTKKALQSAGLISAYVPITLTVLVIEVNGKTIMCDAGGGGQVQAFDQRSLFVSGKLKTNMKLAGIDPAKIDMILVSHFHPDHIFGLMEKGTNKPIYPNAEIILSAPEYRWWTDPSVIGRLPPARRPLAQRIQAVFPTWKNIRQVEDAAEAVPGLRFVATPGHTAGHVSFHLSSGRDQLMISNDAAYVPALDAVHPDWRGVFDQDPDLAVTTRRKLLDWVASDRMRICGYHFPWPGVGTLDKDGDGYALHLDKA